MRIALATCLEMPGLIDEDHALVAAFARHGHEAVPAPWNGPFTPFADADITLVRTTWDYTEAPDEFATWLQRLEGAGCRTINPPALMRWNMDKHYLLELQSRGAPLPSTVICAPDPEEIVAAAAGLGLATAVLKPVISATAKGLSLLPDISREAVAAAVAGQTTPMMLQALVPEITTLGETSLVFIAGEFSHAVRKLPKPGDIRCQSDFGGSVGPVAPAQKFIDQGRELLALLPAPPVYARLDAVLHETGMTLMEIELIEPELFFRLAPNAAEALVEAVLNPPSAVRQPA